MCAIAIAGQYEQEGLEDEEMGYKWLAGLVWEQWEGLKRSGKGL